MRVPIPHGGVPIPSLTVRTDNTICVDGGVPIPNLAVVTGGTVCAMKTVVDMVCDMLQVLAGTQTCVREPQGIRKKTEPVVLGHLSPSFL